MLENGSEAALAVTIVALCIGALYCMWAYPEEAAPASPEPRMDAAPRAPRKFTRLELEPYINELRARQQLPPFMVERLGRTIKRYVDCGTNRDVSRRAYYLLFNLNDEFKTAPFLRGDREVREKYDQAFSRFREHESWKYNEEKSKAVGFEIIFYPFLIFLWPFLLIQWLYDLVTGEVARRHRDVLLEAAHDARRVAEFRALPDGDVLAWLMALGGPREEDLRAGMAEMDEFTNGRMRYSPT